MRFLRIFMVATLLCVGFVNGQQFYQSEGLRLFNETEYTAAIDSMIQWADRYSAERGIAYYYVGESYYNLGLNAERKSRSISHFQESTRFLDLASKQTDIITKFSQKQVEIEYKKGWCQYRLAELLDNPVESLRGAYRNFMAVMAAESDSLKAIASYMIGETRFREAVWKRIQMLVSPNEPVAMDLAVESLGLLDESAEAYQRVRTYRRTPNRLIHSARLRLQDVFIEKASIVRRMSAVAYANLDANWKGNSQEESALSLLKRANYSQIYNDMDPGTRRELRSVVTYLSAAQQLLLFQWTGDVQYNQNLNAALDSLNWAGILSEKQFMQANRDQLNPITSDTFLRLTDANTSLYTQAAKEIPEAAYWMGWTQFVANVPDSRNQFNQFLAETEGISGNPRLEVLREDAQYRLFLLQFDQSASNRRMLSRIKKEIENFRPKQPSILQRRNLLLQLSRIGLGEPIWGRILQAPADDDRFRAAFILIRNMMVRATRVTGREREPYLTYLDRLMEITQDRRGEETLFYRGLAAFLKAEIQETSQGKRQFYVSAGDMMNNATGDYTAEAKYVQARSYFAAAKHESNEGQRSKMIEQAKPIFTSLIQENKSLRSLYYLGEIYRIQGNDQAARRCYETVIQKTQRQPGGAFWFNNASAALVSCGAGGHSTVLNEIPIQGVIFPERLLEVNGEEISLEKFADPDYIRRQYWEEALTLLSDFGLPRKLIYPSVFRRDESRYDKRAFGIVTAGIQERIGSINSGLNLKIIVPQGILPDIVATIDGVPMEMISPGVFEKAPLSINQTVEIRVECDFCYPFSRMHRLVQPGVEQIVVPMTQKARYRKQGEGTEAGVYLADFTERLDGNIVLRSGGAVLASTTFLYKHMQSDLTFRDFVYVPSMQSYLVVTSEKEYPHVYRNDPLISQEGEMVLDLPEDFEMDSPEGIEIDSKGNIYIVDWGKHRISMFTKDGSFIRSFGKFGFNTPQDVGKPVHFVFPTRITIAEDENGISSNGETILRHPQIYVTDRRGIHVLDSYGNYLATIAQSSSSTGAYVGVAVKGYGTGTRLYGLSQRSKKVDRFVASPASNR